MNILFVIANLRVGGAQSFLLRMLSAFPKEHNIYLYDVHPKQRDEEILSNLSNNITIFSSKYENFELKLKKYPKIFTKILNKLNQYLGIKKKVDQKYFNKIIRSKNIQIINSHMYLADSFVAKNISNKTPLISSFHGCYTLLNEQVKNRQNLKTEVNTIFNKYSGIIYVADKQVHAFEQIIKLPKLKFEKIYNGFYTNSDGKINIHEKYNIPKDSFIFGMIARGDITKGWQEAIDAFEKLQKQNSKIYLILSGGTIYLENLQNQYKNNINIIFTGNVNNPLEYIRNYDVALLPTYFPAESLPNTIIEYLYCAKPVIATNWAEIPKMLEFDLQIAGEIISIKNGKADTQELYIAMKSYVDDHNKIAKDSIIAKKAFEKFNMQKCTDSYINIFHKTIKHAV